MPMLLVIDAGNSMIHVGLFSDRKVMYKYSMPSFPRYSEEEYREEINGFLSRSDVESPLKGVIIASVVSWLTDLLSASIRGLSRETPLIVNAALDTGLRFGVSRPEEIGADRIADAVAAAEMIGPTVLVVDLGTATTISIVKDMSFIGGAILPGLGLMGESLHRGTSRLPALDAAMISGVKGSNIDAVGKNTIKCMISGIIYGTAGAVEKIIEETERQEGCTFEVVITGGHACTIAPFLRRKFILDPDLALRGLQIIYNRNARRAG
jgi:type III pantothenate kinase